MQGFKLGNLRNLKRVTAFGLLFSIVLTSCSPERVLLPPGDVVSSISPNVQTTTAAPLPQGTLIGPVNATRAPNVAPFDQSYESRKVTEEVPKKKNTLVAGLLSKPSFLGGANRAESACQRQLKRLGVRFDLPAPVIGKGACGIAAPVKVKSLSGGIDIIPDATLNCPMALAFAKWVKNELAGAARVRYLAGIKSIHQMSAYSCRTMNNKVGGRLSEHAKGNAIDIGKINLNNGKTIVVRRPGLFAFREKGLLNSVRAESCKYFTTVLGPGSDRYHKDHFHFDLRQRKTNYKHCSL
ncbi:MAG: extensin family protein [Lentilitoribacter sp.]